MKDKTLEKNNMIIICLLSLGLIFPAFLQNTVNLGANKQLIIGTMVNTALLLSGIYVNNKKALIGMSTLPSISNILTGILFEGMTYYSKLMLPFIWIGNLLLIGSVKLLKNKSNYLISGVIGIVLKVTTISLSFLLISNVFNFPDKIVNVMSSAMSVTQFYTASLGLLVSLIILRSVKIFKKGK